MHGWNVCLKYFAKKNIPSETTIVRNGFPLFRRRDHGRTVIRNNVELGNKYIVPYNWYLLVWFHCHYNIKWCKRSSRIKYLFKYVNKGPDRIKVLIKNDIIGQVKEEVP